MLDQAIALQEQLTRLRRAIHQQPELGFEEVQTAALVAQTLADLGLEYQTGVATTGVVARLGQGQLGAPVIGIRADMDALPIQEANDVPYKSQIPDIMHACGHDAHTAMLLGAAMLLQGAHIPGEIRLLFQPSEERQDADGQSGGMRMIAADALAGLDAVIALHVTPGLAVGQVSISEGVILANADQITAKIMGQGGHGAAPHMAHDPIFLLAPVLTALHGIISRRIDPMKAAVLTIGQVCGGTADNVIPSEVTLGMTLRSHDDGVREQLLAEVELALRVAQALGGDYQMDVRRGYPAMYNDPAVAGWLRTTAVDLLGAKNVLQEGAAMGSEDFGYMSRASQGAMLFLGTRSSARTAHSLHHPQFDLDESVLPLGTAVLAETALRFAQGRYS